MNWHKLSAIIYKEAVKLHIINTRRCMRMASTIQVRVDNDLKSKSDKLFHDLGTDTTTAIRIFLTQAVANNGFPFEIKRVVTDPYVAMTEEQMIDKLAKSRQHAEKGECRDADVVIDDMRAK